MKIVVCVKQVGIVAARSAFDGASDRPAPECLVHTLNPHDEAAVEEALRIRDTHGGDVTAVSLGPPRAADALRRCLAMGADDAVHLVDGSSLSDDPWAIARALARVVRPAACDLVLCGRIAVDDGMGVVGTFLAELLELPVVTAVVRIDLDPAGRKALLHRALDRGNRETVECPLPAVLTVDKGLNRPRYPTLAGRRRAERRGIRTVDAAAPGAPNSGDGRPPPPEIVRVAPPRIRPRKILAPCEDSSASGRLQWVLSGGRKRDAGDRIAGDPVRLAEGIVGFLAERKLLPGSARRGSPPEGPKE